jgi:hypothetical protein
VRALRIDAWQTAADVLVLEAPEGLASIVDELLTD